MVHWLRLRAPNAGGLDSIHSQGTRPPHASAKILHAATNTWNNQINNILKVIQGIRKQSDIFFKVFKYIFWKKKKSQTNKACRRGATVFTKKKMISNICKWFKGLPWWLSGEKSTCSVRDMGLIPGVRKIPRRRTWQVTPVFLPGKSHGQRGLAGTSPWSRRESDTA